MANTGQAKVGFLINWKYHIVSQPPSYITCFVHNKAPQTKHNASICTNNIILKRTHKINSFYNDVDETIWKPNHYTIVMGLKYANRENNKPYWNGNGQIWARIEKRKRRHLGRMGNIKKTWIPCFRQKQGGDGHVKAQNGVTKTEIDCIQARYHHRRNSHQQSQHWKWPQYGYDQH